MGLELDWTTKRLERMIRAIEEDDIILLQTVDGNNEERALYRGWEVLWVYAQYHTKFDTMDILLSARGFRPVFLLRSLLSLISCYEWRELRELWIFLRPHIESLSISEDSLPGIWEDASFPILPSCNKIIYKGSIQDLEIFFDIIQVSRSSFHLSYFGGDERCNDLAILPALVSRKLSILKILSETRTVSIAGRTILNKDHFFWNRGHQGKSIQPHSAYHIANSPLNLAIGFILDLQVVEYLCDNGARLEKSRMGNGFDESDILQKLRLTTTVSDARKQSCYAKGACYEYCFMNNSHDGIVSSSRIMSSDTCSKSLLTVWKTMCRILFENDCRDLYDINGVYSELTWAGIQKELYPDDPEDISIKQAASWPAPLSTQESWDDWRLRVIDILEKTHHDSLETSKRGF